MAEAQDNVSEKVSLEIEARPLEAGSKIISPEEENKTDNTSDEKPPNPPTRDYSLENSDYDYSSEQKQKTLSSIPKRYFIYEPETHDSKMSCLSISLVVINLFIWVLGAAITALGIWIKADEDLGTFQENLDVKSFTTAGWMLIFIGIIIMIIGFIGCYGAIMSKMCCLIVFATIVCIVIVMEIIVMAVVWSAVSNKNFQEEIKLKAKKAMGEMTRNDKQRHFIDLMQAKLKCCGVDGPSDYSIDPANLIPIPPSCTDEETGGYYQRGCYHTIINYLESKAAVVGGIAVAVFLLQLGVLVFTVCMLCSLRKAGNSFI